MLNGLYDKIHDVDINATTKVHLIILSVESTLFGVLSPTLSLTDLTFSDVLILAVKYLE